MPMTTVVIATSGPRNPWQRVLRRLRDFCSVLACFALACGVAAAATYTATWTQLSTSNTPGAPAWRGWSAMTWVGSENRIVLWGGSGAVFMNDVVGLDPVSGGWSTFEPSTNCPGNTLWAPPNGSDENGVVHDPLNDQLWLYNGGSGYRCATTAAVGRTAGAGTTSTSIVDPTLPSTVTDHYKDWTVRATNGTKVRVNAYNAGTKTLTLSAAIPVSAGVAYDLYVDFGDGTWSYSFVTGQYAKLSSRHFGYNGYVPPARKSPGFAGDATRAILFGGADFDNGTYKLDFATRSYSVALPQGLSTSPAARGQIPHQFVYDSVHDRYVLFGGRCFDPGRCSYQNMLDDTWIYNANTNAWTQVTPAIRPAARNQGQMYFDAANGVVVLYGGSGNGGVLLNDLWTFDVATLTWTQQAQPPTNPGGIYLGQIAYAPTTACGYLVYGLRAGATVANGTWRLCLAPSGGGGNTPPIASFTTTPSSALVGAPIAMSAAGSSDPGGSIVNYAWNFGDGTTGTGVNVSKSYATTGTKTVTLTVTDNGGLTATTTRTVTITATNLPPVANFTATPTPTTTGTPIAFSGATSADPDGSITGYAWNFGDGTTGSGVSVAKAYANAGTYTVTLTVTDNGGLSGSTSGTVTVTAGTGVTTVWMEDAVPAGAQTGGNEPFTWVASNPTPFSGALAHQSTVAVGQVLHGFVNATATLPVGVGDVLYTYVHLDAANPPRELLVQWNDGNWEHRARWGADLIALPVGSGPGNRYMGPLPPLGQWARLEVAASQLGLEGRTVRGMSFSVYDGRATWDQTGKISGSPPANQLPIASFTATPTGTTPGTPIALSAAGSADPDGTISSYAWNFGDGTTGTGISASKAYAAAGIYTITLTVTDNGGLTGTTTRTVTVSAANQPPVASFVATPTTATKGTPIALSATASADPDGTIASYAWNFGDGSTGTGITASKTYAVTGTYTITLTVTDNGGVSASTTRSVTVTGVPATWFDDGLPVGAVAGGNEPFTWVASNPSPYSGTLAHQSTVAVGQVLHGFVNASATLPVSVGDVLYTYVYLDPANPPRELLVQWNDGNWEHRARWGANLIPLPVGSGPGNRYMGVLPALGSWVRLEVPAALLGLEGRTVKGMSFSVYDGRATWDQAGKLVP